MGSVINPTNDDDIEFINSSRKSEKCWENVTDKGTKKETIPAFFMHACSAKLTKSA